MYGWIGTYDPDHSKSTSTHPEVSGYYLNTESLFEDCGDCVFLPRCLGECPLKRRKGFLPCPEYRNAPDSYVLHICSELKARLKKRTKAE